MVASNASLFLPQFRFTICVRVRDFVLYIFTLYPVHVLVVRVSMKVAERKKDTKLREVLGNYFAYLYALEQSIVYTIDDDDECDDR